MQRRRGFTLVELMVSMALIIFIMTILTEAFIGGLNSFQVLKANGDMDEKLRGVANILRGDLVADHFEDKRRLSDPNFWSAGPPREGFFRIFQGSSPFPGQVVNTTSPPPGWQNPVLPVNAYEGQDFNIPSWHSVDHMLHFTVRLRNNERSKFFAARIPPNSPLLSYPLPDPRFQPSGFSNQGVFHSQLAEVVYFLRPNGKTAGSTPLYNLYRRVLVVVPNNVWTNVDSTTQPLHPGVNGIPFVDTSVPPPYPPVPNVAVVEATAVGNYAEFSCHPEIMTQQSSFHTDLYFNNFGDLAVPLHRYGMVHDPVFGGAQPTFQYPGVSTAYNTLVGSQIQSVYTYPKLSEVTNNNTIAGQGVPNLSEADLLLTDVISFDVRLATPQTVAQPELARAATGHRSVHRSVRQPG